MTAREEYERVRSGRLPKTNDAARRLARAADAALAEAEAENKRLREDKSEATLDAVFWEDERNLWKDRAEQAEAENKALRTATLLDVVDLNERVIHAERLLDEERELSRLLRDQLGGK